MRDTIQVGPSSCQLELEVEGGVQFYYLGFLQTEVGFQGQGYASKVVEVCQFLAGREGYPIRLWAGQFAKGMDTQALYEFYQRKGFVFFDAKRPNWMEWRPCPQN
jgi:GNAT superfamily N-acetyltransferase